MQVKILFFASLRDVAGCDSRDLELPVPTSVAELLAELARDRPALERWLPHVRVAVNLEYASAEQLLNPGDEVALIPPVSGGGGLFAIRDEELSLDEVVAAARDQLGAAAGAICTFTGVVRGYSKAPDGVVHHDIQWLEYEAYAPMAEREMARIGAEILAQWGAGCAMTHRVGRLSVGEASVAIAVASSHRGAGMDACRYAIEELKKRVPVWKRETAADGHWWVEGSTGI